MKGLVLMLFKEYDNKSAENVRRFKNGVTLINKYEGFNPNMTFVINTPAENDIEWRFLPSDIKLSDYPFDASKVMYIPGEYWVSDKRVICFEPREDGRFIMIAAYWGGPQDKTRGSEYSEFTKNDAVIYSHKGMSNGGKKGVNYYVVSMED